jgi:hypothetical protein
MRRSALAGLLVALSLAIAAPARADAKASAEALFQEGLKAMDQGKYAEACAKLDESMRLDPAPGTLLNLAECEDKQGKIASAWGHLRHALDVLPPRDERRAYAETKSKDLEKRLPRVSVRVLPAVPAGARVTRDGEELGAASLGVLAPVDPGKHERDLVRGDKKQSVTIDVAEGESRVVALDALSGAGGASGTGGGAGAKDPGAGMPATRIAGLGTGGLGIAALTLGVASGLAAIDRNGAMNDHCNADRACDPVGLDAGSQGKTYATVSTVSFIAAGALLAGTAYLLFFAPR